MASASLTPAVGVALAAVIRYALCAAAETVKLTPDPPVVEVDNVPSVAVKVAGPSALYATNVPPAEFTPLANLFLSAVPRLTADPVLLVTVGTVPSGAFPSPAKVRILS